MDIQKVPYILEVWEDRYNKENKVWDEIRVIRLGASDMDFEGKAYNISFKKTVHGEITLSFSLYGVYTDSQTGKKVENYLVPYLYNEAKIKLCRDGEWYDFIVKSISEAHGAQLTRTYTCQYLPIYELSKIGYNKVFSLDNADGSGLQSAGDFMEDILEDTEWNYIEAGTEGTIVEKLSVDLSEVSEEICYEIPASGIQITNFTILNGILKKDADSLTLQNGRLLIPWSQIGSQGDIFCVYDQGNLKLDQGLILKEELVIASDIDWDMYNPQITIYSVEVPKESKVSEWVDGIVSETQVTDSSDGVIISQYCNKIRLLNQFDNEEFGYYRVTSIEENTSAEYKPTSDKVPVYYYQITADDVNDQNLIKKNKNSQEGIADKKVYLACYFQFGDGASTYKNHYYRFCAEDFGLNRLNLNTEIRVIPASELNRNYTDSSKRIRLDESYVRIILGKVSYSRGNQTYSIDSSLWTERKYDSVYAGTLGDASYSSKYYILDVPESVFPEVGQTAADVDIFYSLSPVTYYRKLTYLTGNTYYTQYNNLVIPSDLNFPENFYEIDIKSSNLSSTSSSVFNIKQFFKYGEGVYNNKQNIEILGYAPVDETQYYYVEEQDGQYWYNPEEGLFTLNKPVSNGIVFNQKYNRYSYEDLTSFIMYHSLEGSKSNCFDLTQKVAESFELWCRYLIEHDDDGRILIDEDGRRKKWVTLTTYAGQENQVGFIYGFNTGDIKRDIKTESLVTKLFVEYSENNYTPNGYVAISDAEDNVGHIDIIYNFDYFTQIGLLNKEELYNDLYKLEKGNFNVYTSKCLIEDEDLDEAPGFLRFLGLLNTEQKKIQNELIGDGTGLYYQKVELKEMINAYDLMDASYMTLSDSAKQSIMDLLGIENYSNNSIKEIVDELKNKLSKVESAIASYTRQINSLNIRKSEAERKFNQKYSRYIQEGSWNSKDYINSNQYYKDALKVSADGAKPNVSYSITAADLYALSDYKDYKFEVGDVTWVEDTEFFGYDKNGSPYHESVIIKEIEYNLDNPTQTKITIQNFSNKFDDLFQTLAATAQSYSLNQAMYGRASKITPTGALTADSIQNSLTSNTGIQLVKTKTVTCDDNGITVVSSVDNRQQVKITSGGILLTNDGGETWTTGIYGGSINTDLLTAGTISTKKIKIEDANGTTILGGGENGDQAMLNIMHGSTIGGWNVDDDASSDGDTKLYCGKDNKYVALSSSGNDDYVMWAGAEPQNRESAPLQIKNDGSIIATNIQIGRGDAMLYFNEEGMDASFARSSIPTSLNSLFLETRSEDLYNIFKLQEYDDNGNLLATPILYINLSGIKLQFITGNDATNGARTTNASSNIGKDYFHVYGQTDRIEV